MHVITDITDLRPFTGAAFVPTMGALHEGHRVLIREAAASGLPVLVSIFVNPMQFAPHEDLDSYPRTLEQDLDAIREDGGAAVFVPSVETIYPPNETLWSPPLPTVATEPKLEDAHRPHFFGGVCAVVARLFDLTRPAVSFFGEKDWQQLKVIEAMASAHTDRWGAMQIVGVPTVREPDGLALSSRNVHLSDEDRRRGLSLCRALRAANDLSDAAAESAMMEILLDSDLVVDYAVVRDSGSLLQPQNDRSKRALIAATLDGVRLIDNAAVG
ncbi:MAG: pantoate--beta-alanine ligase [Phycisphaerales bacterium]|nr:pantoate--beta-alanine ligase [Phycisphaerales bacterium]